MKRESNQAADLRARLKNVSEAKIESEIATCMNEKSMILAL
jgi:hypothetical protein